MASHPVFTAAAYLRMLLVIFLMIPCDVKSATFDDLCRTRGLLLPSHLFARQTCALCYQFLLPTGAIVRPAQLITVAYRYANHTIPVLQFKIDNETVVADADDVDNPLRLTFRSDFAKEKWLACCHHAQKCCETMLDNNAATAKGWCPRTWDGWQCWNDAPPNSSQLAACPSHIALGSDPPSCMFASKRCEANGAWFRGLSGEEWTNFSTCSLVPNLQRRAYVSTAAYAITIVALIPALAIFSIYRQLRVARVALHRQLFASLLLNATAVIIFKTLVLLPMTDVKEQAPPIDQGSVACKVLLIITKYLRLTNYMWMFCEGFYLHRLISAAFVENNSLLLFYLIGWGLPLIPVIVYVVVRVINASDEQSASQCWAFPEGLSEWVFYIPCLLSLAVNLMFLIDIIRILWLKLRARHQDEPSQYRKAVRATLVLVPLFGLHLTLTMYRPASGSCSGAFIQWYYIADYLLDGLQGLLVALTFCYCNGEVHYLIRRSYQRFMLIHRPGLVFQSWASSGAAPGANHTMVSLAEGPSRRPRATNNCCGAGATEDAPPHFANVNGETGM